jgi:hypothetical protein
LQFRSFFILGCLEQPLARGSLVRAERIKRGEDVLAQLDAPEQAIGSGRGAWEFQLFRVAVVAGRDFRLASPGKVARAVDPDAVQSGAET